MQRAVAGVQRAVGRRGTLADIGLLCAYDCAYHLSVVRYEWDPAKENANFKKHRVHFADAIGALEDERALTIEDDTTAEERFKTLGTDFLGRIVVVAYTYRGDDIRLITARKANREQRSTYEKRRR